MKNSSAPTECKPAPASKAAWVSPAIEEMPRLTELTLQTGIPGGNMIGTGGSTVF